MTGKRSNYTKDRRLVRSQEKDSTVKQDIMSGRVARRGYGSGVTSNKNETIIEDSLNNSIIDLE